MKKNILVTLAPYLIFLSLFTIPFFWFKQGEMDLGGDSSRLYFYDPVSYLSTQVLYTISPSLLGGENASSYALPFIGLIFFLKKFFSSPTILIAIVHGLNLSLGYISCYFISRELIKDFSQSRKNLSIISSILGGLVYSLSSIPILGWKYAILTQTNFSVNPFVFFCLLKFFNTKKIQYGLAALLVACIFSQNFSYTGAPPFFAFFPLSILFIFLHTRYIKKQSIPWKKIGLLTVLFFLIQAFQLLPQLLNLISPGSQANNMLFSPEAKFDRGLKYFLGIIYDIRVSTFFFLLPQLTKFTFISYFYIICPFIIIVALLFNKAKSYLLLAIFFLITLYFSTAHISNLGLELYKVFFNIPGFSMFRNFFGQWENVFIFYYSILFAQGFYIIFYKYPRLLRFFYTYVLLLLFITSVPFISGEMVHGIHWGSNNVSTIFSIDPEYEKVLAYIKSLSVDGKIISFPLTDPGYQVVRGKNGYGAYIGPSTIAYLTGKKEATGYEELGQFKEDFAKLVKLNDYGTLRKLFAMLNVKYIFYNADTGVLDNSFPGFPYGYVRNFLPSTQREYKKLIESIGFVKKAQFGSKYFIYETPDSQYLPHIYTVKDLSYWDQENTSPIMQLQYIPELRFGYFDQTNAPRVSSISVNNTFEVLQGEKYYIDYIKIKEDLVFYDEPTISQQLSSPIYPLVLLKEKFALSRFKQINDMFIKKNIYFLKKRVGELKKWNRSIQIRGNVSSIKEFSKQWKELSIYDTKGYEGYYNYWEVSLVRYYNAVLDLVQRIEAPNKSVNSEIYNKAIMYEILMQQKQELYGLPGQLNVSDNTRKYLLSLIRGMYDELEQRISLNKNNYMQTTYDKSAIPQATYAIYLNSNNLKDIDPSTLKVLKGSESYNLYKQGNLLIGDSIPVSSADKNPLVLLSKNQTNILEKSDWRPLQTYTYDTLQKSLSFGLAAFAPRPSFGLDAFVLNGRNGFIFRLPHWNSKEQYLISFEYNTHNKNVNFHILEDRGENRDLAPILDDTISSDSWQKYTKLVGKDNIIAGDYANSAVVYFDPSGLIAPDIKNDTDSLLPMEFRNISITEIPNTPLILRKEEKSGSENQSTPQISFRKINPSRYEVDVKNANAPYMLVMSDMYNKNWKIFKTGEPLVKKEIASYFGGAIKQNKSSNIFFNIDTMNTWFMQPMAEGRHIVINGYANGWYITPADAHGKQNYALTIELTSQRYFYIGIAASLIGLAITISILIFLFFKEMIL